MEDPVFELERGAGPIVATAIHDGHAVRAEVRTYMKLDDSSRLREEDPYTARWAKLAPTWLVGPTIPMSMFVPVLVLCRQQNIGRIRATLRIYKAAKGPTSVSQ